MVLCWRRHGRVGGCRIIKKKSSGLERTAFKREVGGSSLIFGPPIVSLQGIAQKIKTYDLYKLNRKIKKSSVGNHLPFIKQGLNKVRISYSPLEKVSSSNLKKKIDHFMYLENAYKKDKIKNLSKSRHPR